MSDYYTIDFHSHIKPKALDQVEAEMQQLQYTGAPHQSEQHSEKKGTTAPLTPPLYYTIAEPVKDSLQNLVDSETDFAVISLPSAGAFPPTVAVRLSKLVNDEFKRLVHENPDKFVALGSLPMSDISESIKEVDRVMSDLELSGILIRANIGGIPLDDEKFSPLFEKFNDMGLTVFVHPGFPPWGKVGLEKYNLGPLLGYEFDTVLAATRMIYSGMFDEYKDIKFVFAHLGAGLPFLVHRITAPVLEDPEKTGIKAKKKPIEYMKQLYFDTATSDVESTKFALDCTYEMVGSDKILFGTDYPWHGSEKIKRLRESILRMDNFSDSDKKKILGENAKRILHLKN